MNLDLVFCNADLHCHSIFSDGTLTPAELARRAKRGGVHLWALTDHDEVAGQQEAMSAAKECGMHCLTGIEISVTFLHKTVHIVGLGFEISNADLVQGVERIRNGRDARALRIAQELAKEGIEDAFEGALKYAGNPALIARPHFARYMVEKGLFSNVHEVFAHYLSEGKPGYIPHQWASLKEAVGWIVNAGGMAVIAHPGRYQFTPSEENALFSEFAGYGGQGIEVVTGSHTVSEYDEYAQIAKEFSFFASRGSDFHSPSESFADLGMLPPLPKYLPTVWQALEERIVAP